MGQNKMSDSEREAYRREQARQRRRMEEKQKKTVQGNPAKSVAKGGKSAGGKSKAARPGSAGSRNAANGGRPSGGTGNGKKGNSGRHPAPNKVSRQVGLVLCAVQLAVTLVFIAALFVLNMLPMKYLGIIIAVLVLLWVLPLSSQLISKKKAIAGKVLSVLMSIVLILGSYYIFKTNGTVKDISGGNKKVDKMVVAVLAEDPAENIKDASGYDFGVQYAMKGDDVKSTVDIINKELGSSISTVEYSSLNEQAQALHDGAVEAIIYNDAYTAILEEAFTGYSDSVKIIYTHEITSKLENTAADVKVDDDCFTVYISGIDVFGAIETNSRSDVNIIAVVNPTTHQILLVTTPRDYYVEIPGISGGQLDKLTHAGIYGVDASMATLAKLYDTDIDFYARVNFTSLVQMVDALGGVDVVSEQEFNTSYDSGLEMYVAQGVNHFNGQQALAFSRERQNVDGGDFQRGRNQQAVITAMIKKAISPAILTGANGILSSISGNVDTNMSQEQIQELIKSQLNQPSAWNIKSMSATGTGDDQECYSSPGSILYVTQPDQNSINEIKQAIDAVEAGETLPDSEVAQ